MNIKALALQLTLEAEMCLLEDDNKSPTSGDYLHKNYQQFIEALSQLSTQEMDQLAIKYPQEWKNYAHGIMSLAIVIGSE